MLGVGVKSPFENWTDGIWSVSAGISRYYSRGLTRPELIAPYYCPPNAVKWAQNVNVCYEPDWELISPLLYLQHGFQYRKGRKVFHIIF